LQNFGFEKIHSELIRAMGVDDDDDILRGYIELSAKLISFFPYLQRVNLVGNHGSDPDDHKQLHAKRLFLIR
uniref:Aamy domain-containing protein n=1 Tax=Gongylonema pulchrum TaxID=637853 RepID=A0A183DLX0_9BILA